MENLLLSIQLLSNSYYYYIAISVCRVGDKLIFCKCYGSGHFRRKSLTFWTGTCYTSEWTLPHNYKNIPLRKDTFQKACSLGEKN